MVRRRQETLELRVRDHHRGVVHERMRMNGVGVPQAAIDNELVNAFGVLSDGIK